MRVFVAGASGVVGRPLCRRLREAGHTVLALTRSADKVKSLEVEPVVADIFDEAAVVAAVTAAKPDAIVHQLTSIPARTNPRKPARDFAPTNRLRTEGTRILLAAARAAGARRVIAQSIAFVCAPDAASPAGEEPVWRDQPGSAELNGAVHELETAIVGAGGLALRYGAFYGPGTVFGPGGSFHTDVGRRRLPIVGKGSGVFSFTHVDDAAAATLAALERGEPGVYNIVDDEPAPVREWLPHYASCIGAKPPRCIPAWLARPVIGPYGAYLMLRQPGSTNAKAKAALGWAPTIPSWRDGFRTRLDT